MPQYFFILGREPELSVAEIWQVSHNINFHFTSTELTKSYWLIESKASLSDNLHNLLAGTIKMGEVVGIVENNQEDIAVFIEKYLPKKQRLYFGFSWYPPSFSDKLRDFGGQGGHKPKWLNKLGLQLKHQLAGEHKVRFVVSKDEVLSSVTVQKNHLLPPIGWEFVFLPKEDKVYIGRTLLIQPFADFCARDFTRPGREARVGMLPLKLARLMVNLAGGGNIKSLLDPFCGVGTILQEAALLGVSEIYGADKDEASLARSKMNWQWLLKKYPQVASSAKFFLSDIKDLSNKLSNKKFEAIVTEPYLGPALTSRETSQKLEQIMNELTFLYRDWLKALPYLLSRGGKVVMVWPAWRQGEDIYLLPLLEAAISRGFVITNPLPDFIPADWLSERGTMFYERPNQHLLREIVVLTLS